MQFRSSSTAKALRLGRAVLFAIAILVVMASLAYAIVYTNIDLNDNSVDEWSLNGIPVFQTDPTGDATSGRGDEDIINAWVASSDTDADTVADRLDFLLQVNASAALDQSFRGAIAILDCNGNGIDQEFDDRLVVYLRAGDQVRVLHGDQFGQGILLGPELGQRVGAHLEWGVPLSELGSFPDDSPPKPAGYCQNNIAIRFATANVLPFPAQTIDLTEPLREWNAPNAVGLRQFEGNSSSVTLAAVLVLLGVTTLVVTGWQVIGRRKLR